VSSGNTEVDPESSDVDDDVEAASAGIAAGVRRLVVGQDDAGARIDAFIAARDPDLTRAQAQRLLDEDRVRLDGAAISRASQRLRAGQVIEVEVPAAVPLELLPEAIPLVVLYEDEHVIAIDKPAGLVVHPAPGHPRGTLVNALLHHCGDLAGIGGVLRPGIVHRLDKDTSGVMIASKHDRAHTALVAQFQAKQHMVREYLAICAPPPPQASMLISTLHGRHPTDRKRFSSKVKQGKAAITHVRVVEATACAALICCRLETGRTHQIRVHCADRGFALIGDPLYGTRIRDDAVAAAAARLGRQALHACRLDLDHPITGVRLELRSEPPDDFRLAWQAIAPR
jgi:23S rRNA pseudouridine1911/1915/1917 synthase